MTHLIGYGNPFQIGFFEKGEMELDTKELSEQGHALVDELVWWVQYNEKLAGFLKEVAAFEESQYFSEKAKDLLKESQG